MKSYQEFLTNHGDVPENARQRYVSWVRMFFNFTREDERGAQKEDDSGSRREGGRRDDETTPASPVTPEQVRRFQSYLEKRYENWKVREARRSLQLYTFYVAWQRALVRKRRAEPARPEDSASWTAVERAIERLMRDCSITP